MPQLYLFTPVVPCACGCGIEIPATNKRGEPARYAHGHNRTKSAPKRPRRQRAGIKQKSRYDDQEPTVLCACGCGTLIPPLDKHGQPRRYAKNHHRIGAGHSPEARKKIGKRTRERFDAIGRKPPFWHRWLDPRYAPWRLAVFERDHYTCQTCGWVGTANERGFAAHHIKGWADYPDLRFVVSNGLTLCEPCHHALHGLTAKPRVQVPCACGCGTLIWSVARNGKPRRFVNGHANRGKHWSEDVRRKMGAAKKGKKASPETRAKLSAMRKGKPVPVAMQEASRKAHTGSKKPEVAERNRARVWTDEAKAKMSAAKRGAKASDETRAKMSAAHKGKPKSPEHRAALTAARRARAERERLAKQG